MENQDTLWEIMKNLQLRDILALCRTSKEIEHFCQNDRVRKLLIDKIVELPQNLDDLAYITIPSDKKYNKELTNLENQYYELLHQEKINVVSILQKKDINNILAATLAMYVEPDYFNNLRSYDRNIPLILNSLKTEYEKRMKSKEVKLKYLSMLSTEQIYEIARWLSRKG